VDELPMTIKLTIGRQTKTLTEWAKVSPVKYSTIYHRIQAGWTPYEAVFAEPSRPKGRDYKPITIDGRSQLIKEWAKESPVAASTIAWRLRQGWPPREAVFAPHVEGKSSRNAYRYQGRTLKEWAESGDCAVSLATLRERVYRLCWDIERALHTPFIDPKDNIQGHCLPGFAVFLSRPRVAPEIREQYPDMTPDRLEHFVNKKVLIRVSDLPIKYIYNHQVK
jgi:hypothetical protein